MKKYLALSLCALLLTSSLTACETKEVSDQIANITNADDSRVDSVKNGTSSEYPGKTWGNAFESFFSATTWKYFNGTLEGPDEDEDGKSDNIQNDIDVVEFTGHCTYSNTDVLARIQFRLYDDGTFEPVFLAFNEVPQNKLMLNAIIEKAFENAPAVTTIKFNQIDELAPAQDKGKTSEETSTEPAVTTPQEVTAEEVSTTPEVTAAPSPAEKSDPRIGAPFDRKVVVSDASAGIYLRPEPNLNASHLLLIPKNEIITVYNCSSPGWFYTTYDGTSGYVYAEYTKDPGTSTGTHSYVGYGRVDVSAASAGIYLRPYANLDAEWLTLIPKNTIIDLYSCDSSDWYYTYYDGMEGYVYAEYIDFGNKKGNSASSGDSHTFLGYGTVTVSAASAGIYLRPYCDLDAEWLVLIPKNLSIPLYSSGYSGWYYTCYDGQWGYVYAEYIS